MLTLAEINFFLAAKKSAISVIDWRPGISKKDAQWWNWDSALEVGGIVSEGTRIIMQWRTAVGAASSKYSCVLLYQTERIYAVDFAPDGQHTDKVGKGRPYFGKRFGPGTHEHTWSDDGDGYAEPIGDFKDFAALFAHFCAKTNIEVVGGFRPPPWHQPELI